MVAGLNPPAKSLFLGTKALPRFPEEVNCAGPSVRNMDFAGPCCRSPRLRGDFPSASSTFIRVSYISCPARVLRVRRAYQLSKKKAGQPRISVSARR